MIAPRQPKAFTLIELLVVVAVILILATLLMPTMTRSMASSIRVKCASRLRQLHASILMYAKDYLLRLPPTRGYNGAVQQSNGPQFMERFMWATHPRYIAERDMYYCPIHWRQPDGLWKTTAGTVIGKCWDLGVGGYFYLGNWTAPPDHMHNNPPALPKKASGPGNLPLITDAVVCAPGKGVSASSTPHRIKKTAMIWWMRLDGALEQKNINEILIRHRISDNHYAAAW